MMRGIKKESIKEFFTDVAVLLVACLIGSYAVVGIMVPNGLTSGGLTGIIRLINSFVDVNFSILYYGGSVFILILVFICMGVKDGRKLLVLGIMYPAVMVLAEQFPIYILQEEDVLLAAVFYGVMSGICSGLVFWRGYSFAGTDAISKIIRKKCLPYVKASKIMISIDAAVIIISAFVFSRNIALYALITQAVFSKTLDTVLYGFKSKVVQMEIITSKVEEISQFVIDMDRGVQAIESTGLYTHKTYNKLVVLCNPRESLIIKKHIAKVDPAAFISVIKIDTVWGNGSGFDDLDKD